MLEREGYAVAAGSALGFVALGELHFMTSIPAAFLKWRACTKVTKEFLIGHGSDAFGFMDTFLDRLFEYIGSKEVYHVRFFFIALITSPRPRTVREPTALGSSVCCPLSMCLVGGMGWGDPTFGLGT